MDKTVDLFTQFVRLFNTYEAARDKAMHAVEKQTGFIVDSSISECMKAHESMMRFVRGLAEAATMPAAQLGMRWFALKSADNGTDTRMHDLGRFNTQHEAQQAADKLAGHTVVLLDEKDAADWAQTFNLIK